MRVDVEPFFDNECLDMADDFMDGCYIETLLEVVRSTVDYLKSLKERFNVDVFCSYRSNCDHAGFEVSHRCLELFMALEVPFSVSVIVG